MYINVELEIRQIAYFSGRSLGKYFNIIVICTWKFSTVKIGFNEQLGTGQIYLLQPGL